MGNDQDISMKRNSQIKHITSFIKERNSTKITASTLSIPSRNPQFGLEKKWQAQLLNTLSGMIKQQKWKDLAKDIRQIVKSINQQMFIKAVSTVNTILNTPINQFEIIVRQKQKIQEQFNPRISVLVVVQQAPFQNPQQDNNSPTKVFQKKSQQSIRKEVGFIIRKQLNQKYHPINEIKQSFMMMFQMKFREMLDSEKSRTEQIKQKINQLMFIDIDFFCQLVVKGCTLYKPWILKLTGIKQTKYVSFAKKMIVQSLFSKHSMHEKIFPFLIQLNKDYINSIMQKIPNNLKITYFKLNPQLQIQQNYHGAMMAFSEIDSFTSPRKTLQQLNKIKIQVCNDVQKYHQHFQTGQTYSIDGDNMLGIICFMLCKLKAKMVHLYCQIQLLNVAYGDNLSSAFQSASYMVSTVSAAFDYLSSQDFKI